MGFTIQIQCKPQYFDQIGPKEESTQACKGVLHLFSEKKQQVLIFFRCGDVLGSYSEECITCVSLYMASGGTTACLSEPADRFKKTYGGLMLVSNKELKDCQTSGFNPLSYMHGYLKATVSH